MLLTARQSDWAKGVGAVLLGLLTSVIIATPGVDDSPVAYIGSRIVEAINCGTSFILAFNRTFPSIGDIYCKYCCAGGKQHTDVHGVTYRSDPLAGKVGVASDYGSRLIIQRVHPPDMVLLQVRATLLNLLLIVICTKCPP